ncbi:unnamed protein product, partial [Meganyctiphanes norvegica]|uniref:Metalloendopeptidase OMA1, mitochondrial n=1 Tax=Meganyctiphanes norvegica TaxID=48144 RepID=A0AAV2Q179_MEGNR
MFRMWNILRKETLNGCLRRKHWQNNVIWNKTYINNTKKINRIYIGGSALISTSCFYFLPLTPIKYRSISSVHKDDINSELHSVNVYFNLNNCLLPVDHPHCKLVEKVVTKLLNANQNITELGQYPWTITIVDHDSPNAFSWKTGHILMSRGLIDLVESEDQLAWVLAHEMSHVILKHHIGFLALLSNDFMIWFPMACVWTWLTSADLAIISIGHMLMNEVVSLLHDLPYSRKCEKEADILGLHLTAQASYDVHQVFNFLDRKEILDKKMGRCISTWLSTHPSNDERQKYLDEEIADGSAFKKS